MGSMRLGELSIAGKIVIFILICSVIAGGYYGYVYFKYSGLVKEGNTYLSNGDYDNALIAYNNALEAKSFGSSEPEVASLISNVGTIKESEITKLQQEIVAVIGDKYGGIEGANTIAIRKGYYSAVEIEPIQNKINRLKTLKVDTDLIRRYQQILDNQKLQSKK